MDAMSCVVTQKSPARAGLFRHEIANVSGVVLVGFGGIDGVTGARFGAHGINSNQNFQFNREHAGLFRIAT
jgi:hypothetical protein